VVRSQWSVVRSEKSEVSGQWSVMSNQKLNREVWY